MEIHLNFSNTNNTATNTSTSITSGLAQFMATFAQIIGIGMYNNGTTQNAVGTEQTNLFVGNFNLFKDNNINYTKMKEICKEFVLCYLSRTITTGFNVTQITYMSVFITGSTMFLATRIEVGTS